MSKVKVIVAGPRGKMGSEALRMIEKQDDLELIACLDHKFEGKKVSEFEELPNFDVDIYTDIEQCFQAVDADVLVDLTTPEFGYLHTKTAIKYGIRPVVGTTGFSDEQLQELTDLAEEKGIGVIIAPNFALGAVLMMQFAKWAAKYFPDVEIIEKHHDRKLDAPSGTAVKTAQLIQEERESKTQGHPDEKETIAGARGADVDGMKIHSMRLPGLVAHQEVVFGSAGENLTIKHDSFHRESFMTGVKLAIDHVMKLDLLVYGLENILE
ncbi:4-hydroxy-tetrahydrodipicolinate reductase [Gracilibacillus caseinilyticus]|uniref:4-hydroxy-tetrahydrodipicolinate reductase n=1 Tax=Gracilibacillus caseinilyticus TaxID=2932256 RepID=A0ABY4EVB2_9BACI|nr:4-hydroxy-tetrahydrodipicolinate reductase [Gracilibacillus caseinilyticus]UOQ47594.1 4-hydroxy-tetrahydrodipicolinate reductase [Gracilibacillus caseinilyticus]